MNLKYTSIYLLTWASGLSLIDSRDSRRNNCHDPQHDAVATLQLTHRRPHAASALDCWTDSGVGILSALSTDKYLAVDPGLLSGFKSHSFDRTRPDCDDPSEVDTRCTEVGEKRRSRESRVGDDWHPRLPQIGLICMYMSDSAFKKVDANDKTCFTSREVLQESDLFPKVVCSDI